MSTSFSEKPSVAQECRATTKQTGITMAQVELIKTFLETGNSEEFREVKELVLRHVFGNKVWRYYWWNQLMIFFTLRTICPEGVRFESFGNLEKVWKDFSTHTKSYRSLFKIVGVEKIHRDLVASVNNRDTPHWLGNQTDITRFMGDLVPEYMPHYWAYLGTDH